MAALRSWLALVLLVTLVKCQSTTTEEEEEALFTERVPASWLRPVPFIEDDEEEEAGFTERVPASWLRPVLPPEEEFTARNPPPAEDTSSPTAGTQETTIKRPSDDVQARSTLPASDPAQQRSTVPSGVGAREETTPSSGGSEEGTTPSSGSSQEGTILSSVIIQERTNPSSGSSEEGTTQSPGSSQEGTTPSSGSSEEETGSSPSSGSGQEGTTQSSGSSQEGTTQSSGSSQEGTTPSSRSSEEETGSSPSSGSGQEGTTQSSGGAQEGTILSSVGTQEETIPPSGTSEEETAPSSGSGQEGTTLSSGGGLEGTTPSSGSVEELKPTQAVPASWQPELPPPETAEEEEGLEFREPPPKDSQETRLWVTPSRIANMQAQPVVTDTVLPDHGKFQIDTGVKGTFASPRYPGKYPRYVWNTWKFSTSDADSTLQLSCDVIELGGGDFLMVRSDAGGRQIFHSHVKSIETSAVGSMTVEFRSDREEEGRLHCSVRAVAGAEVESAPGSETPADKEDINASLQKVDINYPSCGKTKFNTRIVGGSEPPAHSFPWLVALQTRRGKRQFCGGTIINERYIVTAAHCVDRRRPTGLSIAVAKHKRKNDPAERIFDVKKITMHENYNRATQDRDIAIIELRQSLRTMIANKKGWVRPICLPQKTCRTQNNCFMSRFGLVAGWGLLDSTFFEGPETVQYVKVPILSNNQCQKDYAKERIGITRRMLCAGLPDGGKDSCQGDSGGPLAVVSSDDIYTLAGIVSFGKGCALAGYPGIYVRVSELTDWIRDHSRL